MRINVCIKINNGADKEDVLIEFDDEEWWLLTEEEKNSYIFEEVLGRIKWNYTEID